MELRSKYFSFSNSVYDVFVAQKKLFEQPKTNSKDEILWNHHRFIIQRFVVFRFLSLTFFFCLEKKKYFSCTDNACIRALVYRSTMIYRKRWTNSSFVRKKRVDSTTNTNIIITFAPLFQMAATFLLRQCWKTL